MPYSITTNTESRTTGWHTKLRWLVLALNGLMIWTFLLELPLFSIPADRTLYFKLPIQGVEFHWEFVDRDALLAGELTLRIFNDERDQTLVIFRDGKISEGWAMIGDEKPGGGFYFGFATDERFRTARNDSLIITLKAVKDLAGRGPHREGVLAAGTWQMTGTYSSLYGGRWNPLDLIVRAAGPPVAYMECWDDTWPITITKREGWNGPEPAGEDDVGLLGRVMQERGVDGRTCGSHF